MHESLITSRQPGRFCYFSERKGPEPSVGCFFEGAGVTCFRVKCREIASLFFFFPLHGKNKLQGWEEQTEVGRLTLWGGGSLSAGRCPPGCHLPPSAQFGACISLTCQHLSGRQHQPSETEHLSKELLAQSSSRGRERSMVGGGSSKHTVP